MTFISKESLIKHFKDFYTVDNVCDEYCSMEITLNQLISEIEDEPEVEVVPISWIEEYRDDLYVNNHDFGAYNAIGMLLNDWEEENETN